MFEIILGCIVFVALITLIIIIYHNKYKSVIVKIEEAENNIGILLDKKLDLLKKCIAPIRRSLKDKTYMEDLEEFSKREMTSLELHNYLRKNYNKLFKTLDENEKLYKRKALVSVIDELNENEISLSASIKFYNDNVSINNKLVSTFPSNIIRIFFGYKSKDFYDNEKREVFEILKDK
ncbi:MAG: LemA family protein [Bacilli bacterium]|nr:LemA family protein [Bacilli bacterium]